MSNLSGTLPDITRAWDILVSTFTQIHKSQFSKNYKMLLSGFSKLRNKTEEADPLLITSLMCAKSETPLAIMMSPTTSL